jgi:hypothetical protein
MTRIKARGIAILCALFAVFLALAPTFMDVKNAAGLLGFAALFAVASAIMFAAARRT